MTEYGEFISKAPYVTGALTSIDAAVAKDGKPGRVALKRFHPPPSRQVMRVLHREGWRLSMERQQRAARAGAAAVEVLGFGSYPEGEYAIFPWNRRSLHRLITSISPTGDRLRAVTAGMLAALKSWELHYGSPHGNLKSSNVFVVGEGPLPSLRFLLSDPAWRPGISAAQLRRQELAQLGAIVVQMVRRREAGEATIEDAPEWRQLGRAGVAWRDFSNFLLDPNADPSSVTLEAAEARLKSIPHDFQPRRVALRAGAGVALLLSGVTLGYARFGDPQAMPGQLLWLAEKTGNPHALREQAIPEWALLCRAWDDWVADLTAQSATLEETKELWSEPDPLRAAFARFRPKAEALRPQALLTSEETEGRSLASLALNPPASVRRERVVRRVLESWEEVSTLQQELDTWWRWAELRALRDGLAAAGKREALARLEPLVPERAAVGAPSDPRRTFGALLSLLRSSGARTLLTEWKAWQSVSSELQNAGDRVQAAMPALALQALPDTRDLAELATSLTGALNDLRRRRALFLDPGVARDRFLQESPIFARSGVVGPADLELWEREVRLFSQVRGDEDPRSEVRWDERLATLQSSAADLEDELPVAETDVPAGTPLLTRVAYETEAERLRTEVKILRSRVALRRDLPELTGATVQARQNVQLLEQRLEATLVLLRPDRWLAGIAARTWPYEAARERWEAWRRERLANVSAALLEKDRPRFRRLRKEERTLRDWLAALDSPSGLGPNIPLANATPETSVALEKVNTRLREQTVSSIIAAAEWNGGVPASAFEETLSRRAPARQARDSYHQWSAQLPAFALDLDHLGNVLTDGLSWIEGVAESLARVRAHPEVDTLDGTPRAWLQGAQRLRDLAATADVASLAIAITGGNLATGLTAWKRLGELAEWPASSAQLTQELEFGTVLREKLSKIQLRERREKWNVDLAEGQRARWLRLARMVVKQPAQVDPVFSQAAALGVEPGTLEPAMAYNVRLWELARQSQTAADLKQLKTARDSFLDQIKQLAALPRSGQVDSFLKAIEAVPLQEEGAAEKTRTPRSAGWREEPSDDGHRLAATWSGGGRRLSVEYQLIEPTDGTAPFFLARRTLAVGEFLDLLALRPEARAVFDTMPAWVRNKGTPPGNVVMGWRPRDDGEGLELSTSWFYRPGPLLKGQLDERPESLAPAINERPTVRSPLQFVPPEVARAFVEQALGARLPTPAEWNALSQGASATPEGNFRSTAFKAAWDYTARVRSGDITLAWRPATGAFLPGPAELNTSGSAGDDGSPWPGSKSASLWPASVDDGPITSGIIHLFGNIWVYLYDEEKKEYYVAGGSVLAPPTIDIRKPQRLRPRVIIGRRGGAAYGDGFTDVGVRPAFDAPASVRQRLQFFRLVRTQPFITN